MHTISITYIRTSSMAVSLVSCNNESVSNLIMWDGASSHSRFNYKISDCYLLYISQMLLYMYIKALDNLYRCYCTFVQSARYIP